MSKYEAKSFCMSPGHNCVFKFISVFRTEKRKKKQKQTDNDTEHFFCLIKLRAHFKDINRKLNIDQGNLPFRIKNKQKWALKDFHHNISAFIDLINY